MNNIYIDSTKNQSMELPLNLRGPSLKANPMLIQPSGGQLSLKSKAKVTASTENDSLSSLTKRLEERVKLLTDKLERSLLSSTAELELKYGERLQCSPCATTYDLLAERNLSVKPDYNALLSCSSIGVDRWQNAPALLDEDKIAEPLIKRPNIQDTSFLGKDLAGIPTDGPTSKLVRKAVSVGKNVEIPTISKSGNNLLEDGGTFGIPVKVGISKKGKRKSAPARPVDEAEKENLFDFNIKLDENFSKPPAKKVLKLENDCERKTNRKSEAQIAKTELLTVLCSSLIGSPNFSNRDDPNRLKVIESVRHVAKFDPEFVLKSALYARQELNIRTPANFLLALAAYMKECRPYLKKYFGSIIRMPSDWMEVPELWNTLGDKEMTGKRQKNISLPTALRRAMVEKFADFDEFSLAKHNKNKKTNKHRKAAKKLAAWAAKKGVSPEVVASPKLDSKSSGTNGDGALGKLNLKKLIRALHINKPAALVMALVGKKYPTSQLQFMRSGLLGVWEESKAGKRMKLAIPETWETQIASRGNKAVVWQELLDNKKLGYMALLRNLRNLIKAGVSAKHHDAVIQRLQNEKAVISSRQFPFRFFSAFAVLDELKDDVVASKNPPPVVVSKPAVKVKGRGRGKSAGVSKQSLTAIQRKQQKRAVELACLPFGEALLARYQKALEAAIKIATLHNVRRISGRTMVFVNVGTSSSLPCTSAKGLGKPRTVCEISLLLALMCKHACEDCRVVIYGEKGTAEVSPGKGTILQSVQEILKGGEIELVRSSSAGSGGADAGLSRIVNKLETYAVERYHIDNLLIIGRPKADAEQPLSVSFRRLALKYRHLVNEQMLCVSVDLAAPRPSASSGHFLTSLFSEESDVTSMTTDDVLKSKPSHLDFCGSVFDHPRDVWLAGFSDQILRYVAEQGGDGQLQYVDGIDSAYKLGKAVDLPIDPEAQRRLADAISESDPRLNLHCFPESPIKTVRVFVSSTFRDMHGERNILARVVFPELKRRAAKFLDLDLSYVDLRWGLPGEELYGDRAVELCLTEVVKSQLFIGILGDRYGFIPRSYGRPAHPELRWLEQHPDGSSLTELEILQFLNHGNSAFSKARASFYFRCSSDRVEIPEQWEVDMKCEGGVQQNRLLRLKDSIRKGGYDILDGYDWHFGGVMDGKPVAAGLHQFAQSALDNLWSSLLVFHSANVMSESDDELRQRNNIDQLEEQQWVKIGLSSGGAISCGHAYKKLRSMLIGRIRQQKNGQTFVVQSQPGGGKTTFMCQLASACLRGKLCLVLPCFAGFNDFLLGTESFVPLAYLCRLTGWYLDAGTEALIPSLQLLKEYIGRMAQRVVILLDGWTAKLLAGSGLADLDVPNLTVISTSDLKASVPPSCQALTLPSLTVPDQIEMIRQTLAASGKTLDESSFNNQMRLLLSKRGSDSPSYIGVACGMLASYGNYEQLSTYIRSLPPATDGLVKATLQDMEAQYSTEIVSNAVCILMLSSCGLSFDEWYGLTNLACIHRASESMAARGNVRRAGRGASDDYCDAIGRKIMEPGCSMISRGVFMMFVNSAKILIREIGIDQFSISDLAEPKMILSSQTVEDVVRSLYMRKSTIENEYRRIMAAYFYSICITELHSPGLLGRVSSASQNLLLSLTALNDWQLMTRVLTSFDFLSSCVSYRMLSKLMYSYSVCAEGLTAATKPVRLYSSPIKVDDNDIFFGYSRFVSECAGFIDKYPDLFLQIAANQPLDSILRGTALGFLDEHTGRDMLIVANVPAKSSPCVKVIQNPYKIGFSSVTFSPDDRLVAAGCVNGKVIVMDSVGGQESMTFHEHSQPVTSLAFLDSKGQYLCSVGQDKRVFVWDLARQSRHAELIHAHNDVVSSCVGFEFSGPGGLVTGGWDGYLVLWDYLRSKFIEIVPTNSPVNSLSAHPKEPCVASGHWDATIKIYNLMPTKRKAVLRGHESSVRCVAYSPCGSYIVSSAMGGDLRLWSAAYGVQIGVYSGHTLPTTQLRFAAGGDQLVSSSEDGTVKVFAGRLGLTVAGELADPEKPKTAATAVCLAPNGDSWVCGFDDGRISMMSFSGGCTSSEKHSSEKVTSIHPARDGHYLVCYQSTAEILNSQLRSSRKLNLVLMEGGKATSSAVGLIYYGITVDNGSVMLFSIFQAETSKDSKFSPEIAAYGHDGSANDLAFSPSGGNVATVGNDRKICIWGPQDISIDPLMTQLDAHRDRITACSWLTNKPVLVTGSADWLVKTWSLDLGTSKIEPLLSLAGHSGPVNSLASWKGCIASGAEDGRLILWSHTGIRVTDLRLKSGVGLTSCDLHEGESESSWSEMMESDDEASGKAINFPSKLDKFVVVGAFQDGSSKVWKPFLGEELVQLNGHLGSVGSVAASNAGKSAVSVGMEDSAIRWWSLEIDRLEGVTQPSNGDSGCSLSSADAGLGSGIGCPVTAVVGLSDRVVVVGDRNGRVWLKELQPYVNDHLNCTRIVNTIDCIEICKSGAITGLVRCNGTGQSLMSGGEDGMLWMLDIQESRDRKMMITKRKIPKKVDSPVLRMDCTDDGMIYVMLWSGRVLQFDGDLTKQIAYNKPGFMEPIYRYQLTPAHLSYDQLSKLANQINLSEVTCSGLLYLDAEKMLGDISGNLHVIAAIGETDLRLKTIKAHDGYLTSISFSYHPSDDYERQLEHQLITTGADRMVKIWTVRALPRNDVQMEIDLIACWEAPAVVTSLSVVDGTPKVIWAGDILGGLHCLEWRRPGKLSVGRLA